MLPPEQKMMPSTRPALITGAQPNCPPPSDLAALLEFNERAEQEEKGMKEAKEDVHVSEPLMPTRKHTVICSYTPGSSPKRSKRTFTRAGVFPFLTLSGELRNQIYGYVLLFRDRGHYECDELHGRMRTHRASAHPSHFCATDLLKDEVYFGRCLGVPTALLRVCKQIHCEAIGILYSNTFLIDIDYRHTVLSQSPVVASKPCWPFNTNTLSPVSTPKQWDVSRITKLHLRVEMHEQKSTLPAVIHRFSYPGLSQMTSLKTLEISVLYTLWSKRWTVQDTQKHDEHCRAMRYLQNYFPDPDKKEIPGNFRKFMINLLDGIPKGVKSVVWKDDSEGFREKNTGFALAPGMQFLKKEMVKEMALRECRYVKKEVLEMVASGLEQYRGYEIEIYEKMIKSVEATERIRRWKELG